MPTQPIEKQKRKILEALADLPAQSPVRAISEKIGRTLSVADMAPLVRGGLVDQSEVAEAPVIRFTLSAKGREWLEACKAGDAPLLTEPPRPADGPLTQGSEEVLRELRRRFDTGEGATAESRQRLADELGITRNVVSGCRAQWLKKQESQPAPPAPPEPAADLPPPAEPYARISPAVRDKLYARFAAGEGETADSRKILGREFGLLSTTVFYHLTRWKKAGQPNPAAVVAAATAATAAAGMQTTVDGAVLLRGPGDGSKSAIDAGAGGQEIEQQPPQAQQGAQGAAFDGGTTGEKIEQAAGVGPATVIRCQEECCAHFRIADEQPGCAAPAMPPGQVLGFKNNNWPETADCPHVEPVLIGEQVVSGTGHILGAGDTRGNQVDHDGPGDLPAGQDAQPPKRDLDAMIAEALPARRRGNHQHPLPPPQPVAPKPEEKIPERGQICEAQVARVEVDYVLVDLIEFYMPDSKRWIRGRIRARELLRRGPIPDCTRVGLMAGDMLNVQVLDVQEPEYSGGRLRVELSSRLAPPHPKERHGVLEQGGQQYEQSRDYGRRQLVEPRTTAAPIVARGAEVAADLDGASTPGAAAAKEARRQAQSLVHQYRLAPCHVAEYAERILAGGVGAVEEQLKADLAHMAAMKEPGVEGVAPDSRVALELVEARGRIALLEEQLAEVQTMANHMTQIAGHHATQSEQAQTERDQARRAVADLIAQRDRALAAAVGLCETCVHRLDGFCPYPDMYEAPFEMPDADKPERHHGRRIVFGRMPVIECELHRAEVRHAQA